MRILFLDLDTLRPDHLGCYGYRRNTSPNIDRIARDGVRFTNYYCSDAPCLPSRAALVSGRFGIHNGVVGHDGTAADMFLEGRDRPFNGTIRRDGLFGLLQQQHLHMASISPFAERHGAWWFYAGFHEIHNTGRCGSESAEEITPVALDWIERNASKDNWFLHVNYWDPHTEYRAPEEFGNPFEDQPIPDDWITREVFDEHLRAVGPHTPHEIAMYSSRTNPRYPRHPGELKDLGDVKRMFDGYDCGIAYMDSHIGMIFDALERKGVMDDLAVIITSDHGENMGELAIYGEHGTADAATCRIPMIVRWPGCKAGYVDNGMHYNIDLVPTLADLLGKPHRDIWDGASYAPALREGMECGRDYLVLSQCAHVCQRSVLRGDYLYMRTYHDGFHLFPDEMLYNLREDRHEQRDLAGQHPEICRNLRADLQDWHDCMMASMPQGHGDPLWAVMREEPCHARRKELPEYCKHLEATGRGWAIPELLRRHPERK